ncbi:MAG: ABC transporter permease [Verrucomicrobia bacterium]|nr:ABC transporter permease [Verrucomicrobiota bacterium]
MDQENVASLNEPAAGVGRGGLPHTRYEGGRSRFLPYLSPVRLVRSLWRHRALLHQLSKSRFSAGHREDVLGMAWLVLEPLALLGVFSVVFIVIFKAPWPGAEDKPIMRVLCLYAGIVTYQMFAQTVSAAAGMIRSARGYVKLMVFPTEVLPASVVGGILVPSAIGFALLLITATLGGVTPTLTALWLPVVLIPMWLLLLGLVWFLSALCVFVPDVRTVTALVARFMFFLTPIVYPLNADRVPNTMRFLLRLNPLTTIVENVRRVLIFGQGPEWGYLAVVTLGAALVCQVGFASFMRSKRWFADVI